MPVRKPGWWELNVTLEGPTPAPVHQTVRLCTDAAVDQVQTPVGIHTGRSCPPIRVSRTPDGWAFEATCVMGQMTISTAGAGERRLQLPLPRRPDDAAEPSARAPGGRGPDRHRREMAGRLPRGQEAGRHGGELRDQRRAGGALGSKLTGLSPAPACNTARLCRCSALRRIVPFREPFRLSDTLSPSAWQFWIDRGGTFTDIVARRPDGSLVVTETALRDPGAMRRGDGGHPRQLLASRPGARSRTERSTRSRWARRSRPTRCSSARASARCW